MFIIKFVGNTSSPVGNNLVDLTYSSRGVRLLAVTSHCNFSFIGFLDSSETEASEIEKTQNENSEKSEEFNNKSSWDIGDFGDSLVEWERKLFSCHIYANYLMMTCFKSTFLEVKG